MWGGARSTQVRSESRGLVQGHSLTGLGAWPPASGHSAEKPLIERKGGRTCRDQKEGTTEAQANDRGGLEKCDIGREDGNVHIPSID